MVVDEFYIRTYLVRFTDIIYEVQTRSVDDNHAHKHTTTLHIYYIYIYIYACMLVYAWSVSIAYKPRRFIRQKNTSYKS